MSDKIKIMIVILIAILISMLSAGISTPPKTKIGEEYSAYYNELTKGDDGLTADEMRELKKRSDEFLKDFSSEKNLARIGNHLIITKSILIPTIFMMWFFVGIISKFKTQVYKFSSMLLIVFVSSIYISYIESIAYGVAFYFGLLWDKKKNNVGSH